MTEPDGQAGAYVTHEMIELSVQEWRDSGFEGLALGDLVSCPKIDDGATRRIILITTPQT